MKQCVCKGWQFSWPRIIQIQRNRTELEVEITFTSDFAYDLGDSDQEDWIKIDGLYWFSNIWRIFNTHYLAAILGAAYNPDEHNINLVFYYHDGNSNGIYDNDQTVTIPLESTVRFKITKLSDNVLSLALMYNNEIILEDMREFKTKIPNWSNRINYYFGGNRKAPNKTCVEKN